MSHWKKLALVSVASMAMSFTTRIARADDAKHKLACMKKCEDSGFQVVVGDKHYKLDDGGNEKAKEYIKGDNASTKVTIDGKMADDKITDVQSIKPAEESK